MATRTEKPYIRGSAHAHRDVPASFYREAVIAGLCTAEAIEAELLQHGIVLREHRVRDSLRILCNMGILHWVAERDGQVTTEK